MLHHFPVLASTSSHALALAQQGAAAGTVVLADSQTGGRGRGSRLFCSPLGGLYFSLILRPELEPTDLPLLTLAAGVGLCRGLVAAVAVQPLLKWPNDLYLAGRKLGGILTESGPLRAGLPEFVVIGVGINVAAPAEDFPPELRGKIISLAEVGAVVAPAALLPSLVDALRAAAAQLKEDKAAVLAEWRQRDYLLGRQLEYNLLPATGAGLAEDGRYLVASSGRNYWVTAGDIHNVL